MEDNRVPSFVQYPQKRKRTISNNVTSPSIRAYKRHGNLLSLLFLIGIN